MLIESVPRSLKTGFTRSGQYKMKIVTRTLDDFFPYTCKLYRKAGFTGSSSVPHCNTTCILQIGMVLRCWLPGLQVKTVNYFSCKSHMVNNCFSRWQQFVSNAGGFGAQYHTGICKHGLIQV